MCGSGGHVDMAGSLKTQSRIEQPFKNFVESTEMDKGEPHTLEIMYSSADSDIQQPPRTEVVYEDPNESERRPRLLVSLQSVMALKSLCEREFCRVNQLTTMLHECRTAYYKELLYLREQLLLATRPEQAITMEAVKGYEVYWYDPSQYVDGDTKDFLMKCIRMTNKQLIEENKELMLQLEGKVQKQEFPNNDLAIKALIRRMGVLKLMQRIYGILTSKDHGSKKQVEELESAFSLLFGSLASGGSPGEGAGKGGRDQEAIVALQEEIRLLKSLHAKELQAMKDDLQETREEASQAKRANASERSRLDAEQERADAEKERADAEKERADDESARAQGMESQLREALERLGKQAEGLNADSENYQRLRSATDLAASRVKAAVSELVRKRPSLQTTGASAPKSLQSAVHPDLEQAVVNLQDLVAKVETEKPPPVDDSADKAQLKQALEAEKLARDQAQLKQDTSAELSKLKAELDKAKQAKDVWKLEKDKFEEEVRRLETELEAARSSTRAAPEPPAAEDNSGKLKELQEKLEEAQEAIEKLSYKLADFKDRIKNLKAEVKVWKRKAGVEVEDSDEESEDDLPSFLMSYTKRVKNSVKPRWLLLAEDAHHTKQKRAWMWAQKYRPAADADVTPSEAASHRYDASSALSFLRAPDTTGIQVDIPIDAELHRIVMDSMMQPQLVSGISKSLPVERRRSSSTERGGSQAQRRSPDAIFADPRALEASPNCASSTLAASLGKLVKQHGSKGASLPTFSTGVLPISTTSPVSASNVQPETTSCSLGFLRTGAVLIQPALLEDTSATSSTARSAAVVRVPSVCALQIEPGFGTSFGELIQQPDSPGAAALRVPRAFPSASTSTATPADTIYTTSEFGSSHLSLARRSCMKVPSRLSECSTNASDSDKGLSSGITSPLTSRASPKALRATLPGMGTGWAVSAHSIGSLQTVAQGGVSCAHQLPMMRTMPSGWRMNGGGSSAIATASPSTSYLGPASGALGSEDDGSPKVRRTSGAPRETATVQMGRSHSAAHLPFTNMSKVGARGAQSLSPKPPRRGAPGATAGAAVGAVVVACSTTVTTGGESHLAEVLPPLPPGRIRKSPAPPTWLVSIG